MSAWLLVGFVGENIISILNWFIVIFALVFSIRTAVKMIMGETIIFREDIIKISIGVIIPFLIIQIISMVAFKLVNLDQIGKLILIDVSIFSITYYYLNKFMSKNFYKHQ